MVERQREQCQWYKGCRKWRYRRCWYDRYREWYRWEYSEYQTADTSLYLERLSDILTLTSIPNDVIIGRFMSDYIDQHTLRDMCIDCQVIEYL